MIVSVIGATVLLIGIALIVLPGPAFVVIPVGLAILATEYAWARRWLRKIRQIATDVVSARQGVPIRGAMSSTHHDEQEKARARHAEDQARDAE